MGIIYIRICVKTKFGFFLIKYAILVNRPKLLCNFMVSTFIFISTSLHVSLDGTVSEDITYYILMLNI